MTCLTVLTPGDFKLTIIFSSFFIHITFPVLIKIKKLSNSRNFGYKMITRLSDVKVIVIKTLKYSKLKRNFYICWGGKLTSRI